MCFQLYFCSFVKQDLDEYNAIALYSSIERFLMSNAIALHNSIERLFAWWGLFMKRKLST